MGLLLLHEFETLWDAYRFFDSLKGNSITRGIWEARTEVLCQGSKPQIVERIKSCFRFLEFKGTIKCMWSG